MKSDQITIKQIENFCKKFVVNTVTGCWDWIVNKQLNGYGTVEINYKQNGAHRFAYIFAHGHIPKGLCIDHLCRNRACVNPAHLEAVTQRENLLRSPITDAYILSSKKICKRGHSLEDRSNVLVREYSPGRYNRACLACRKIYTKGVLYAS